MELKITKEKVLDAASKCSTAKATLEVLFPEAFKHDYFRELEDFIQEWINSSKRSGDAYHKVDGKFSDEKAKSIINLIKKTYNL